MDRLMKKVSTSPRSMKKRLTSSGRCQHKCFGLPLTTVLQQEYESGCASPEDVPLIVQRICDFIVRHGLNYEGIFRINGNSKTIENLRQQFENHEHFDSSVQPQRDIFAMADLLKLFLRELPGGIVSEERTVDFLKASELIPTSEMRRNLSHKAYVEALSDALDEIRILIATLPVEEYNLLKYLIRFLSIVSEKEDVNKMSPTSLGIVFGPNVFRCGLDFQALRNQGSTNRLIAFFIEHYDDLFNMEAPSYSPYRSDQRTFFSTEQTAYGLRSHSQQNTSSLYRRASGPVGIEVSYDRRGPGSLSAISRKSLLQENEQLYDPASELSNSHNQSTDDTTAQNKSLPTESIASSSIKRDHRDPMKPSVSADKMTREDAILKAFDEPTPVARARRVGTNNANVVTTKPSDMFMEDDSSEMASTSFQPEGDGDNSEMQSTMTSNASYVNNSQPLASPRLSKELSHQLCHIIRAVIDEQCFQPDKRPSSCWPPLMPAFTKESDKSAASTSGGDSSSTVKLDKTSTEMNDESEDSSGAYHTRIGAGVDILRAKSQSSGMAGSSTAQRLSAVTPMSDNRWDNESPLSRTRDPQMPELRPSSQLQRRERYESSERQSSILSNDEYNQGDVQPVPERRPASQQAHSNKQYSSSITRVSDLPSLNSPPSQQYSSSSSKMHPPPLVTEITPSRPLSSTPKLRSSEPVESSAQDSLSTSNRPVVSVASTGKQIAAGSIPSASRAPVQEAWTQEAETRPVLQINAASQSSNTLVEHMFDTLMLRLEEKRRIAGRPEQIDRMTPEEVQEEKLEIQKCLLHYENLHGRPSTAQEKAIMKPLYDRYRQVKQAIASLDAAPEAQPLPTSTTFERSTAGSRASLRSSKGHPSREEYDGVSSSRVHKADASSSSAAMFSPLPRNSHEDGKYVPVADRSKHNVGRLSSYSTADRMNPAAPAVSSSSSSRQPTAAIPVSTVNHPAGDGRSSNLVGASRHTAVHPKQAPMSSGSNVVSNSPEHDHHLPTSSDANRNALNPYQNMELNDLLKEEAALRNEKIHLQRLLKEFEYRFLEANGRRVEHDDRVSMRAEYNQYKQIKQRLRLLEEVILRRGELHK